MIGIVERLRFDATRCEIQFSKGIAGNIEEAANEIERLRRLVAWCRPRLSKDVYRTSLDDQLVNPRQDDGSTMTNGDRA